MSDLSMTGKPRPRLKADAYDTIDADWIVPALTRTAKIRGPVWEPAAGANHLTKALKDDGHRVYAMDIKPRAPGVTQGSIYDRAPPASVRSIVTNPPYSTADVFITRALSIMRQRRGQVAMLMRSEWHSAAARHDLVHTHPAFAGVVVLTRRPKWFTTNEDSPRHNFSWFVWDWQTLTSEPWIRYAQ